MSSQKHGKRDTYDNNCKVEGMHSAIAAPDDMVSLVLLVSLQHASLFFSWSYNFIICNNKRSHRIVPHTSVAQQLGKCFITIVIINT